MLVLNLLRYLLFILVCFVVARPSYAARLAINVIPAYQRVDLNWAEVSGAAGYRLCAASVKIHNFANCGKDGNSQLLEINTGNTAIKATGLVNGVTYHFRVLAVNAKGLTVSDSGDKTAIPRELALNDTGVTACSDYTDTRSCPVNNFPGQDAEFGRDRLQFNDSNGVAGFNFTKIGPDGEALPVTATRWNCVKDEMTGLMWEVKTRDGGYMIGSGITLGMNLIAVKTVVIPVIKTVACVVIPALAILMLICKLSMRPDGVVTRIGDCQRCLKC
ncbi:hypothetical protein VZ94_04770 [Methylocucumis oryzae]|uniref:Fibronectin type-III domain-containing protein n=2 Tax=Methylocucumis oryzae TaxID=1632867 RepID=A0A0F3IP84_9GAMM|nr:hypothetical protein VZ94_04770 [Methylocucumis oryzae]